MKVLVSQNEPDARPSERGVHAASASEMKGGFVLYSTRAGVGAVKRREHRAPLASAGRSALALTSPKAWFRLSRTSRLAAALVLLRWSSMLLAAPQPV